MNRGEGAKFAAKAKSGQIGIYLFKDTKPNRNKKFGYKQKSQAFPIRKVTTGRDSEVENKPVPTKKPTAEKSSLQKNHSTNAKDLKSGRETITSDTTYNRKQSSKDFVKKNVQKFSEKTKEESKDTNTVALTQDQLNAILKSIGQITGSEKVASIEIENGNVKVNAPNQEPPKDKPGDSTKDSKPDKEFDSEHSKKECEDNISPVSTENILSLLGKLGTRTPSPVLSSKPPTPSKAPASVVITTASHSPKKDSGPKTEKQRKDEVTKDEKTGGTNQIGSKEKEVAGQLEFSHLSLAERKRRRWQQERDELAALEQQLTLQGKHAREVIANKTAMAHHETNMPEYHDRNQAPSRNTPQADTTKSPRDTFSLETSPRVVAPSSLSVIETQRIVPAAMRSSFLIGGQGSAGSRLDDHNTQVKRRQQQEWLKELEQQRIEAHERKEQEKKRQQEFESNLAHQWAEPVDVPKTGQISNGQLKVQDDSAMIRQTDRKVDNEEEIEQPHSAPPQGSWVRDDRGSVMKMSENRSHIRAHNLLLDPAEIERREAQRVKHMEHMLAVKAQVEEKQRLKKEAEERRRQEEAEEEKRLGQIRMNTQHQYELERNKQKRKEEDEAARHRALAESMQVAYLEAQQEKHQKRLDKLAKMGHDTSNLRRSWDNQQEVSQHQQPNSQLAYKASPRPEQPTVPQPVQYSPTVLEPVVIDHKTSHAVERPTMVDAFTSPVYDQAVQTEFHFPPRENVMLQGGLLEREPSAHIEYKPERQEAGHELRGKDKKIVQTQMHNDQGRKRTVQKEAQEGNTRPVRQTSRASSAGSEQEYSQKSFRKTEKPVWGASTKSKKAQRNSDKDLTVSKRKREERRQQRAAELLAAQERNAPRRLLKTKKPTPVGGIQTEAIQGSKPMQSRVRGNLDRNHNQEHHQGRRNSVQDQVETQMWAEENSNLPDSPPLRNGDFVPFLRTEEPVSLSEDSVPVTPESLQMQRQRKTMNTVITDENDRGRREDRFRLPVQNERDPLLNPDRLKDSEQRQERILQQLSHLRQGLMMKQREMELGLNSSNNL
ncbi:coiled-coil domain-containing protein 66-like isoform X2 [Acanthaster planci]|uniref:Coiled-coil domain-containing protein 66-like isoform X2 n=1 Tax=Acanthaster planci TaxID=133434 RepID=A0A8B7Z189_ACAPL|nr:coiled-coil domain-containing protein 66-like isoform X2 [Acanthaster planci]